MKPTLTSSLLQAVKAAAIAITINGILYFIFVQTDVLDLTLPVSPDGRPLSLVPVIIASFLPVLVAGFLFWGLSLVFSQNYKKVFIALATVLLLLSFYTPFSIENVPLGMALVLNLMHVVVAVSTILMLIRQGEES